MLICNPNPLTRGRSLRVDIHGMENVCVYTTGGRKIADLIPGKAWKADVPAGVYLVRGARAGSILSRLLVVLK